MVSCVSYGSAKVFSDEAFFEFIEQYRSGPPRLETA